MQATAPAVDAPTLYEVVEEAVGERLTRGVELGFHDAQVAAWDSTARIVAMIAGSQGGKTSFGPWWLAREVETCGPGDYLAVTATYDLFKLRMLPEIRAVFEDVLGIARYWAGDQILELCLHTWDGTSWVPQRGEYLARKASDPMWGRLILRSASSPGGLESATALAAWLDEAGQDEFSLSAWEAVRRRLALSRGRILITTTPYNLGWLKQQVYDRWLKGDKNIDVIQFASILNPAFSREEFEERRQEMDNWKFRMFYEGQFERPAGLIYNAFIDAYKHEGGHKVRPFNVPAKWPRYVGIDPGGANVAKVWLALDPVEDVLYLYREQLDGGKSTPEHVAEAKRIAQDNGERVVFYVVGQPSESQQRRDWQAAGADNVIAPPVSDVESGIDTVISLLKQYRLFVFDTCTGTLDEFGTYQRKLDENGEVTDVIQHKERFHRLDALRYAVVAVERQPAGRVATAPSALTRRRR